MIFQFYVLLCKTDDMALFDGILGVAFPILSQDPGVPTVLQNLADQKKIDQSQFGFFLGDVSLSFYCFDVM